MRTAQNIPEAILDVLQDTLDRPIAFHRVFVKLTGSVTAALMLSQAVYWTKRANSGGVGWFYKTITQWEEETGLSRHEQETARKALRRFSFWQEERRGKNLLQFSVRGSEFGVRDIYSDGRSQI